MEEKHYIAFIYVETKNGGQNKQLNIGKEPTAVFSFTNDEPIAVFAYCNIHGFWKYEL
jgi:superoxide reductase